MEMQVGGTGNGSLSVHGAAKFAKTTQVLAMACSVKWQLAFGQRHRVMFRVRWSH